MYYDVIMTGFGGQGIQTISLIMALAAMKKELQVTYLPSYGVEKRGGRTNVFVIISDEEIGSPITNTPRSLLALDMIGLEFYQGMLEKGGLLVANTSLIPDDAIKTKDGVEVIKVRFNEEAIALGNPKMANMITLGCLAQRLTFLNFRDIEAVIEDVIPPRLKDSIPDNLRAIQRGIDLAAGMNRA
ncbi:MAG TPA: 2-oxoacid:acceptor oxidoreductase family protein [Spirochaetota bacterium]|nr:2-oxoacid:acceptor oxidoreductase family protein [Spirochaetota bacterium]HOD14312.1 2-oxoacid:acceptor oxidoreductase family protein [Spirochaetota bacterium]HPG52613.1 2-oxoacid:acceptor oxidoreductase family protein [Spirochaetota bacterium]HPN13064.1 2-oxoacid:acceptor oxidoreductase family protein [Spirochaetota bacterium]